jgi:hypothetical protein
MSCVLETRRKVKSVAEQLATRDRLDRFRLELPLDRWTLQQFMGRQTHEGR